MSGWKPVSYTHLGEVYCPVEQSDAEILERLFADCREELPEGCHGRPMALSDVVELDYAQKRLYYYVDDKDKFSLVKFSPMLAQKDTAGGNERGFHGGCK